MRVEDQQHEQQQQHSARHRLDPPRQVRQERHGYLGHDPRDLGDASARRSQTEQRAAGLEREGVGEAGVRGGESASELRRERGTSEASLDHIQHHREQRSKCGGAETLR
eukprot:1266637-Rhodomonas_salina.1